MIRAVIDLNTIVSSILTPGETLRRIMHHWNLDHYEAIIAPGMLSELAGKFASPHIVGEYDITPAEIDDVMTIVRTYSTIVLVPPESHIEVTGDPEDDYVLATGVCAQAHCIVTGDGKLRRRGSHAGIQLLTPREFLAILDATFGKEGEDV